MYVGKIISCPICGKKRKDDTYFPCKYCDWVYDACEELAEDPEVKEDNLNPVSIAEAKRMVARGLNIWGKPLNNKPENK